MIPASPIQSHLLHMYLDENTIKTMDIRQWLNTTEGQSQGLASQGPHLHKFSRTPSHPQSFAKQRRPPVSHSSIGPLVVERRIQGSPPLNLKKRHSRPYRSVSSSSSSSSQRSKSTCCSSSESPSLSTMETGGAKAYEKRARHRTRPERYETERREPRNDAETAKRGAKGKKKSKRKKMQDYGDGIDEKKKKNKKPRLSTGHVHAFQSKKISKDRITVSVGKDRE